MKQKDERARLVTEKFAKQYGSIPSIWARAPGRVDLMGSHTDYNMGYVLTMTIDRDIWIAARPRDDEKVTIYSLNIEGGTEFSLHDVQYDRSVPWTNYVRGVAKMLTEAGFQLRGFDGLIHSTVPVSSGLSSSAAIEMATAVTFKLVSGFEIDPVEMALLGQKAENQFVGVNSGILDQYSSTMGQEGCALLLDCRQLTSRRAQIADNLQVVICDTQAKRELAGSEYAQRRSQCEQGVQLLRQFYVDITSLRDLSLEQFKAHETDLPEVVARRCRFIIEENQRVLDLAEVLPTGDPDRLAGLMSASYAGARDLYEIGAPAMESMMKAMLSGPGVIGARQAGAGFGGCMVALIEKDCVLDFSQHVRKAYSASTGIKPHVYPTAAAPGAGPIEL